MSADPRLTLSLDTCGPVPSVAVSRGLGLTHETVLQGDKPRGETVAATVADALASIGSEPSEIALIGVTTGPGSYTGVRVGLALVRGLALIDSVPVVGISTLDLAAAALHEHPEHGECVAVVLPAGRCRYYAAGYAGAGRPGAVLVEPFLGEADEIRRRLGASAPNWVAVGEAAAEILATDGEAPFLRVVSLPGARAGLLAEIAIGRCGEGRAENADAVMPLYVGGDQAVPNLNRVAAAAKALRGPLSS